MRLSRAPLFDPMTSAARYNNAMLQSRSLRAVMDIVVWLRSLGLGKYEAAFRDLEIDETVLPDLTAEDQRSLASRRSGIAAGCNCCTEYAMRVGSMVVRAATFNAPAETVAENPSFVTPSTIHDRFQSKKSGRSRLPPQNRSRRMLLYGTRHKAPERL